MTKKLLFILMILLGGNSFLQAARIPLVGIDDHTSTIPGGSETSSVNPAIFSGEEDHKTYSMQGRLANNPSKGVYIKNGRKQIVK